MRIAVWHNLPSGGGKRALFDHVRGLKERGHEIEAWCPPSADRTYLPLADLVPEHVVPLADQHDWRDKARLRPTIAPALAGMDAHCRECAAEIDRGGFDVLFANACWYFRTTPIAMHSSLPSAIYLGEPFRWLYEAMPTLCWLAPPPPSEGRLDPARWYAWWRDQRRIASLRLQARMEFEWAKRFDRILVNSLFSRESVLRAYGLDSEVCYLGTDTAHFVDRRLPRENFVIALGAVTPEKNPEMVLRSLAMLPSPRPDLVWVGNIGAPDYRHKIVSLAESLGVTLRMMIGIGDEELVDLLNRATAMIYSPRLEPFGLAPIEAAACGLPVVAVAEGGVRESVVDGETGLLVRNDPAALAAALARLFDDPALRARLGAAARANVERRWTLDACTDRIEDALRSVIAARG